MSKEKGEKAPRKKMSMEERIEAAVQRKIATMAANGVLGTGKKGAGADGLASMMGNPMMMMLMMGGKKGGFDLKTMMMMQMMSGQGGNMGNLLPLMLLGKEEE